MVICCAPVTCSVQAPLDRINPEICPYPFAAGVLFAADAGDGPAYNEAYGAFCLHRAEQNFALDRLCENVSPHDTQRRSTFSRGCLWRKFALWMAARHCRPHAKYRSPSRGGLSQMTERAQ